MFIDDHLHTVCKKYATRPEACNFASPEELIDLMDRTGVDMGVLLPVVHAECGLQYSTTENILDICRVYPDRFIPFCNIDPRWNHNSANTDFMPLLMYYKEQGCKGVGEICANIPFDDPRTMNLFKQCQACDIPALFHMGFQEGGCYGLVDDLHLPRLETCLKAFPKLTVIAHSQTFWAEISGDLKGEDRNIYPKGPVVEGGTVPRLLRTYPNLYCDISAGSGYNALTRDPDFGYAFMNEFQDRLFYGTDTCSPDQRHRHAEFLRQACSEGHITEEVLDNIAWRNLNRVLGLGI